MTEEKLVELVKRIDQKTVSDGLTWETTAYENEFQTQLSNSVIRIREAESNGPELDYLLSIIDKNGSVLESVSDGELSRIIRESGQSHAGFNSYQAMQRIYKNAKRQALGVDKTIDNILSELE